LRSILAGRRKLVLWFETFLLVASLNAPPLLAQENYGAISGVVHDTTDAVLPAVKVTLTNRATGRVISATTEAEGTYRVRDIEPGRYSVLFALRGFSPVEIPDVSVPLGQNVRLDVKLDVLGVSSQVDVKGVVNLIDSTSTVVAHNLTAEQFDHLPKGRNSQSMAILVPFVNAGDVEGGIQVGGASSAENSYTVDGIVTTSVINGTARQDAVMEFVQEIQLKTDGINAEYGGALGGVVSAVTKSGGNDFHGEGHDYLSGSRVSAGAASRLVLDPADQKSVAYFQDPKPKRNLNEFGGSIGGPLLKDRAWFFTSVSPRFLNRTQPYSFSNGTDPGTIEQKQLAANMFTKVTFDPVDKVRVNLGWLYTPLYSTGTLPGYDGYGVNFISSSKTSNEVNKTRGFYQPQSSYTGGLDLELSGTSLLSVRGGYSWDDYHDTAFPTAVSVIYQTPTQGVPGIPPDKQGEAGFQNTPAFQLTGHDLTTRAFIQTDFAQSGSLSGFHNLKAGFGIQKTINNVDSFFPGGFVNIWWGESFTSNVTHQTDTGQYGYYEWNDYRIQGSAGAAILSLYGQDQWTINRLTLNLGVRLERETIPSFRRDIQDTAIHFDFQDKLAPRLGASYDLNGDGRIKIYGSWGRYFDWTKYQIARNEFGGIRWTTKYRSLDTTDVFNLVSNGLPGRDLWNPSVPDSIRNRTNPNFNSIDPRLKPMSQDNVAAGVDYQWNAQTVLSFQLIHNRLRRTIEDLGAIVNGDNAYVITNPGEGLGATMDPSGTATAVFPTPRPKRQYDAFEIAVDRRFADRWFGSASYVFSRLNGNYSGLVNTDEIRTPTTGSSYASAQQQYGMIVHPGTSDNRSWDAPEMLWDSHGHLDPDGPLATDRPHVFKAYGSYLFAFGTEVAMNFYAGSGTPVTTYVWDINAVPVFPEGRGDLGRTPVLTQTDLLVAHEWKLPTSENSRLRFEFNMLNLFNQKTARHVFNDYNRVRTSSEIDFAQVDLAKGYDYKSLVLSTTADKVNALDPRFQMNDFFNPAFAGRFGVKFIF
jgi:Carboxypeptidase regulatory-like domain